MKYLVNALIALLGIIDTGTGHRGDIGHRQA
jgi:hypothetical protein